jgi:hypothetical protein
MGLGTLLLFTLAFSSSVTAGEIQSLVACHPNRENLGLKRAPQFDNACARFKSTGNARPVAFEFMKSGAEVSPAEANLLLKVPKQILVRKANALDLEPLFSYLGTCELREDFYSDIQGLARGLQEKLNGQVKRWMRESAYNRAVEDVANKKELLDVVGVGSLFASAFALKIRTQMVESLRENIKSGTQTATLRDVTHSFSNGLMILRNKAQIETYSNPFLAYLMDLEQKWATRPTEKLGRLGRLIYSDSKLKSTYETFKETYEASGGNWNAAKADQKLYNVQREFRNQLAAALAKENKLARLTLFRQVSQDADTLLKRFYHSKDTRHLHLRRITGVIAGVAGFAGLVTLLYRFVFFTGEGDEVDPNELTSRLPYDSENPSSIARLLVQDSATFCAAAAFRPTQVREGLGRYLKTLATP